MSETKMLRCDTCGGIGEDDVDGWLTVYGTPNGAAYAKAHFCSCACLAEWATSLALEDDAYPPCLALDDRDLEKSKAHSDFWQSNYRDDTTIAVDAGGVDMKVGRRVVARSVMQAPNGGDGR